MIRHAGPSARANVVLEWTQGGLEAAVGDNGRGAAATDGNVGSRQGLVGMVERVALYDGKVSAGPRRSGGFEAQTFIPHTED